MYYNHNGEQYFLEVEFMKNIDEFFIQKAIGWTLREYSKANPDVMCDYINRTELSKLAFTEGMKVIMRQKN